MFARIVGVTFPRRSFASIPGPVASGVEPQGSPCGTGRCWCDHAEQIGRKLTEMGAAQSSLRVRVLRTLEELLKDRPADTRPVDTDTVRERMRLSAEDRDDLARCMSELLDAGDVRGKELRGDNKVMDVTVTAITEQGLKLLQE